MAMLFTALDPKQPGPDGQVPSVADWFGMLNQQANNGRVWAALFEEHDFVLAPPIFGPAFPIDELDSLQRIVTINGQDVPNRAGMAWPGLATYPCLPSTCLPIGAVGHLPVGMQVLGPRWRDRDCVAIAGAIAALIGD